MRVLRSFLPLLVLIPLAACGDDGAAARRKIDEAVDAVKTYTFAKKDEYLARLKDGADHARTELAALEEKAKTAAADAKKDLEPRIAALKAKSAELQARLEDAKAASAETWNATIEKAEAALEALKIETEQAPVPPTGK